MRVDDFLDKLSGVRGSGARSWAARCPCRNDDENPSLSIALGDSDQILLKCHRGGGCELSEICEAVGVTLGDLWPDGPKRPDDDAPRKEFPKEKLELVASYKYRDHDNQVLYEKRRYLDSQGRKTFRTRRWDDGKWVWNMGGSENATLYRLPEIDQAIGSGVEIWVVEGEKDVDTLIEAGLVATTSPHGAGVWDERFTGLLLGCVEVFVVADRDEPGRAHADMVLASLRNSGISASGWVPPAPHKDVADMYAAGLSVAELEPLNEIDGSALEISDGGGNSQIFDTIELRPVELEPRVQKWDDFVEQGDAEYDWLIPGVLERKERVIVVAAEGVGKTYLARQVAICTAAGIQPFTQNKMPQIKTLSVDLENPERIIRRTTRDLLARVKTFANVRDVPAYLWSLTAGLDLLKREDQELLENAIEQVRPDLLIMGPLYKAFIDPGTKAADQTAIELVKYLDILRDSYGCAMWLEHHAPLGTSMTTRDLRPFGSSVWSRWPEFGLSLAIDPTVPDVVGYEVRHFRGPRDERHWPTRMKRGKTLPFEVTEFSNFE